MKLASNEAAFWAKVDRRGGADCWPWLGARHYGGTGYGPYGVVRLAGSRRTGAHRVALALSGIAVDDDLCVLHTCDVPICCNPAHLYVGTRADNAADRVARGRSGVFDRAGKANGNCRLSDREVEEVRRLRATGESRRAVASRFNVSEVWVSRLTGVRRRS